MDDEATPVPNDTFVPTDSQRRAGATTVHHTSFFQNAANVHRGRNAIAEQTVESSGSGPYFALDGPSSSSDRPPPASALGEATAAGSFRTSNLVESVASRFSSFAPFQVSDPRRQSLEDGDSCGMSGGGSPLGASPSRATSSPMNSRCLSNEAPDPRQVDLLRPRVPNLISKEIADQIRKGVSFTANVAGGALRMPELKGLPKAPRVPKESLDLSTAAMKVLEEERYNRVFDAGSLGYEANPEDAVNQQTHIKSKTSAGSAMRSLSHEFPMGHKPAGKEQLSSSFESLDRQEPSWLVSSRDRFSRAEAKRLWREGRLEPLGVQNAETLPPAPPSLPVPRKSLDEILILVREQEQAFVEPAVSERQRLLPPAEEEKPFVRPSTTLDRLSLLTFNAGLLEYRLGGVTWYSNPPFTKRRLYHVAPALRKAECDVIALQEVYEEWQAEYLTEALRITYPFVARRTSGGTMSLHNGLMIMSRFPILRTRFHLFNSVTPIEKMFGSKGMLEVIVEIPTVGQVTFVNVHFASGAVDPESQSIEDVRNDEIQQAFEVCREASLRGEIPIIIGDLNAAPNLCASNYKAFLEHGWRDSLLVAVKGEEAEDPTRELTRLSSWQGGVQRRDRTGSLATIQAGIAKVRQVLGMSEEAVRRLLLGRENSRRRRADVRDGPFRTNGKDRLREVRRGGRSRPRSFKAARKLRVGQVKVPVAQTLADASTTDDTQQAQALSAAEGDCIVPVQGSGGLAGRHSGYTKLTEIGERGPFPDDFELLVAWRRRRRRNQRGVKQSTAPAASQPLLEMDLEADPFCTRIFTWDPENPLNVIGPHSECHGLRCDHIFLPPKELCGGLSSFRPVDASVMFAEPQVAVEGCCCGLIGQGSLVTLSDHYGVRIELKRISEGK